MDMVKLGEKGQLNIPETVLNRLGLAGEAFLILETTADGAIVLRPAGAYPIEMYSNERIEEFLEANALSPEEEAKVAAKLKTLEKTAS